MENENIDALNAFLQGYIAANENKIAEDPDNEQLYRAVDYVLGFVQNKYLHNWLEFTKLEAIKKKNMPEVKSFRKMEDYNEFDNSTGDYLNEVCENIAKEKGLERFEDTIFYKNRILFYQHLKNMGMNVYENELSAIEDCFPAAQEEILDLDPEDIEFIEE